MDNLKISIQGLIALSLTIGKTLLILTMLIICSASLSFVVWWVANSMPHSIGLINYVLLLVGLITFITALFRLGHGYKTKKIENGHISLLIYFIVLITYVAYLRVDTVKDSIVTSIFINAKEALKTDCFIFDQHNKLCKNKKVGNKSE